MKQNQTNELAISPDFKINSGLNHQTRTNKNKVTDKEQGPKPTKNITVI